jgi:xenotropic and polytropic retrovirus receptor 1
MLFLILLFCGACKFWTRSKVNYVFVFEFDTRHTLDWRQLYEVSILCSRTSVTSKLTSPQLPCFFFFLLGFFIWLNFTRYGADMMYIYFPIFLIGVTALILFFPAPILYYRSRQWFLYANVSLIILTL